MRKREIALKLLRENKIVSSSMMVNAGVGYRYGSVLHTLNKDGYRIVPIQPKDGPTPNAKNTWWYQMSEDRDCTCDKDGPLYCSVHTSELARTLLEQTKGDKPCLEQL